MNTHDMLDPAPAQGSDEEEVLKHIFRTIYEQIWWVIAIAGVSILIAAFYAKTSPHIYSADAMLQIESPTPSTSSAAALSALTANGSAPHVDAEIEIIRSRTVVEPVVEQFKLNFSTGEKRMKYLGTVSHLFARAGKPMPAWFGLDTYAWGGEIFSVDSIAVPKALEGVTLTVRALGNGRYQLVDPQNHVLLTGEAGITASADGITLLVKELVARPQTEFSVTRVNQLDAVSGLASGLQVTEKGHDTGIVQLSYTGTDPKAITAITNAVAASYLRHRTDRAQEEASKMLSFLNSELPHLRDELRHAETALSQYQERAGSFQPTQEASVFLSGGLEYEKQIATLRVQRAQLLTRFTEDSPELQNVNAQMAALQRERERFNDRFKTLPGSEREAVSLQRDAKVAEEVYVALLNRIQELSITRAGTIGNVHIVDEALVPTFPVRPKSGLIVSGGAMVGILAGVGFALLRRKFLIGIRDPDMIERNFRLPVLGSISISVAQAQADRVAYERHYAHSSSHKKRASLPRPEAGLAGTMSTLVRSLNIMPGARARRKASDAEARARASVVVRDENAPTRSLLVKANPFDISVDGLRGLRSTLQFGLVDAPNRIVCITSPAPADGKSFVCANLAALLAESGHRVLLIDADLRRGRLAQYFGRSPAGGLTELLAGKIDIDIAARSIGENGLHFIGTGAYPPNPSEILSSARFLNVIQRLESAFELVIIDTPPLLAAPDAAVVANIAGSTIMVIRAGAHTEGNITDSLNKLKRARARVVGSVMNSVELKRKGKYAAYDYAYAYQYRDLTDKPPPKARRRS